VAPLPIPAPQPSPTVSAVAADTSQKLAASQDQVKELLARVHQLESMMVEKDQQLLSMSAEMGAAHEEVAHARQEMHHWREELAELRTKLGNAEKENLTTLQTMVSSLESALATDKKENAAKAQEPMQMPIKGP
jgi:predicted nuclease with TOPRIM domain